MHTLPICDLTALSSSLSVRLIQHSWKRVGQQCLKGEQRHLPCLGNVPLSLGVNNRYDRGTWATHGSGLPVVYRGCWWAWFGTMVRT